MSLPALGWEVYYKDGTVLNAREHDWDSIPDNDVLVVLIWHGYISDSCRQRTIMAGRDYYFYDGIVWGSTDDINEAIGNYKKGVLIDDAEFEALMETVYMKNDF